MQHTRPVEQDDVQHYLVIAQPGGQWKGRKRRDGHSGNSTLIDGPAHLALQAKHIQMRKSAHQRYEGEESIKPMHWEC